MLGSENLGRARRKCWHGPSSTRMYLPEDRREFIRLLGGVMQVVPILRRVAPAAIRDDKFLDVALAGKRIISGDKDLLI